MPRPISNLRCSRCRKRPATKRGLCHACYGLLDRQDRLPTDWERFDPVLPWEPTPWAEFAACDGEDPNLFFGSAGERPETRHAREAATKRQFCFRCPVMGECRAYARRRREFGLWGGESEEDRARAGYPPAHAVGTVARIAQELRAGAAT